MMEFKPGATVYAVERDEDEDVADVSGYMFLALVNDTAIVSPFYNGHDDLEMQIDAMVIETRRGVEPTLYLFPAADCYLTLEAAKKAAAEEGLR